LQAVDALATYHRAVADFRPAVVESRLGAARLRDDEIVCHNDFAPYNGVFDDGNLVGIIDWDVVWPGRPSWDLAFFAWHWVPLHRATPELAWRSIPECERRLLLVADAYGLEQRSGFVEEIIERIDASRIGIIERAQAGDPAFVRLEREGHPREMERAIAFVRSIEGQLQSALVN
jgi:thiamine kinase-like enzyme